MENKYYLAIETKPHNYFPINLCDLSIFKNSSTELQELDSLTLKYKKDEIIEAIKEENLLDVNNDMPLVIIYYENNNVRKMEVLTKDISFDMWKYLSDNYNNKNILNKIYNYLNNKIDDKDLISIKNSINVEEFIINIGKLSYLNQRKLYFYLYE